MMRASLLLLALAGPAGAVSFHGHSSSHPSWSEPSNITCATVRSYVHEYGLEHARAIAVANGMTAEQETRARRCLLRHHG